LELENKTALGIEAKILFLEFFQKKIEAKSPTAFSAGPARRKGGNAHNNNFPSIIYS
jgi:hypothetical protein